MDGLVDKAAVLLALRFFVDLIKADRPLTPTSISGRSVLVLSSDERIRDVVRDSWQQSIVSDNRVVEVGGSYEGILAVLRGDLK
jgi:hypothetical protein